MKHLRTWFEFLWKGLVIGLLNIVSLIVVSGVLIKLGLKLPAVTGSYNYILFSMFFSGFIIAIISGIMIKDFKPSRLGVFISLYVLLSLNSVTQLLEALYFAPGIISLEVVPFLCLQQFIMYLIVSLGITLLFKSRKKQAERQQTPQRSRGDWLLRIVLSSAGYVLFYFIFGSINAMLFTGVYYSSHLGGLSLPSTMEILMLEPIRALILVISVLPVILYSEAAKSKIMVSVGMFLFIIGGLLPMLQQLTALPLVLVVSTTVEMFFQFFLTGVVTTYLVLYEKKQEGRNFYA